MSIGRKAGLAVAVRWLLPLIWMAVIFVVSGTPKEDIPSAGSWDLLVKKGGHIVSYGLLTYLWARALNSRLAHRPAGWLAALIAILYAVSDEFHQSFVPTRNGTGIDVLIDAVGSGLALCLWRWSGRRTQRRTR